MCPASVSPSFGPAAPAFAALLAFLCPEPESERGAVYARTRAKLEDLFRWRGASDPEGLADETLDRVAHKVMDGLVAERSALAYVLGVARLVALEAGRRERRHTAASPDELPAPAPDADQERYHGALERCLSGLEAPDRELLLEYHRGDGRGRIDGRRALAERLGLPLATLRVRAFRIRARVEVCVKKIVVSDMEAAPRTQGVR